VSNWKINRRDEGCAACERPFVDGEQHFSILLLNEEALGRADRCVACFEAADDLTEDDVFWRTRRRVKAKRGLAVDFESVERLFHALDGRSEERLQELRFLLSLLLMRKKRLKLVRVKRSAEGEWMLLRRPRRTEALGVKVFDLTPARAEELRAELERIIEGAGSEDLLAPPEIAEARAGEAPDDEGDQGDAGDEVAPADGPEGSGATNDDAEPRASAQAPVEDATTSA